MHLQKEAEKKRKAELRPHRPGRSIRSSNKENAPSAPSSSHEESTIPSGGQSESGDGTDQSECSVCLGRYADDLIDGILQKEWVQCTNVERCGLWMHSDCLSMEKNRYVCYMCGVVFK